MNLIFGRNALQLMGSRADVSAGGGLIGLMITALTWNVTHVLARFCKQILGGSFAIGLSLAFGTITAHAHFIVVIDSCGPTVTIPGDGSIVGCAGHTALSPDQFVAVVADPNASFFTVYDFGDVTGGVGAVVMTGLLSSGWTVTNNLVDVPAIGTTPVDDPTIRNIRFTCSSCGVLDGPLELGGFGVPTVGQDVDKLLAYDSQAFDSSSGALIGNFGDILVPAFANVPEPATLLLFGVGMLGLVLSRGKPVS